MSVKTPYLSRTHDRHFSDTTPSKKRKKEKGKNHIFPEIYLKKGVLEVEIFPGKKALRRRKMEKGQTVAESGWMPISSATPSSSLPRAAPSKCASCTRVLCGPVLQRCPAALEGKCRERENRDRSSPRRPLANNPSFQTPVCKNLIKRRGVTLGVKTGTHAKKLEGLTGSYSS